MEIKDIQKLANLARMEISESEMESVAKDIGPVIEYVDQIKTVANTLSESQTKSVLENVASIDQAKHVGGQFSNEILNNAPQKEGDYFKVKKVL